MRTSTAAQQIIDQSNTTFWNELCGTSLATSLGIQAHSPESLQKFDAAYMEFYPYLLPHINLAQMKNKKVLEVGIGYGTVSEIIAKAGAEYYGLDIAENPVKMANYRLNLLGLPKRAQVGSILECPFEDNFFDQVVSIGCFHHTGNLQRCFDETYRILKPAGRAIIMVYNKYSLRQWCKRFIPTLKSFLGNTESKLGDKARATYDANIAGQGAPETVLTSIPELKQMLQRFKKVRCSKENIDRIPRVPPVLLLNTLGKVAGLDIYVECIK